MSKERIFHLFAAISNSRTWKFPLQEVGESLHISSKLCSLNPQGTNLALSVTFSFLYFCLTTHLTETIVCPISTLS